MNIASARARLSSSDDGDARAAASAMPLTALRAATAICGGLALGDVHARMAGRAREAWTDGRKGGPPANKVVSHVSIGV